MPVARNLSTLSSPSFIASRTAALCSSERSLNSNVLPGPMPMRRQPGADLLVLRRLGHELQRGVEILVEVLLDPRRRGREEIDLRRGGRRGLLEERGERLRLVARLHLLHVRHVLGIEELRAEEGERERRGRAEDLLDARRRLAFPVGADDEVVAGLEARRAAADVAVVVGVAVDQLHGVVALLRHRRHRDHHRLRAQVEPEHRIRRVAVRRDDRRVLVGERRGLRC